jgi:hypothetical protein
MTERAITCGIVAKGAASDVRVRLEAKHGARVVDLRAFTETGVAKIAMPTARGLSLSVDEIGDLIRALEAARAQAVALGWLAVTT